MDYNDSTDNEEIFLKKYDKSCNETINALKMRYCITERNPSLILFQFSGGYRERYSGKDLILL